MAYTYRGTVRDQNTEPETKAPGAEFDPSKCGTLAGHKQHRKFDTTVCQPCRDAFNAYYRDLRVRRKAGLLERTFRDDKCGTLAGYSRHIRHEVPVCDDCREARRTYRADYWYKSAA